MAEETLKNDIVICKDALTCVGSCCYHKKPHSKRETGCDKDKCVSFDGNEDYLLGAKND
jgi:hypothetical protein